MLRKIIIIPCLLLWCIDTFGQGMKLDIPISIECNDKSIIEIFSIIESKNSIKFYYNPTTIPSRKINLKLKDIPFSEVIKEILSGTTLDYLLYSDYAVLVGPATIIKATYTAEYYKALNAVQEETITSNAILSIGSKDNLSPTGKGKLSGEVIQYKDKSPIIGATIRVESTDLGTITDDKGNFSLDLPIGQHTVLIQYIGNTDIKKKIQVYNNGSIKFTMDAESINLSEVTIGAKAVDANVKTVQIGATQVNLKSIRKLPVFLGETDIIKTLLLTPGVSSLGEGATGFNVRGGESDQNLILQDDGFIFNSSHALGFFSAFNADLIQNVNLYKSIIPSSFGGRLASVLDIEMKEGDFNKFKIKSGIGVVSARLSIEAPIQKGKSSLIGGIRTSYSDWILKRAKNLEVKNSSASFYDISLKFTQKFNAKTTLYLSAYSSDDDFAYNEEFGFQYRTINFQGILKKIHSPKMYSKWVLSQGKYLSTQTDFTGQDASLLNNNISQVQFKNIFTINQRNDLQYQFGIQSVLYNILPGERTPEGPISTVVPKKLEHEKGLESAVFFNMDYTLNKFQINGGLRISHYGYLGPKTIYSYSQEYPYQIINITDTLNYSKNKFIKSYLNLEPRFSMRYSINETTSLKAGYAKTSQYVNQIFNADSPTPTSQYQVSTQYILPTTAQNISIGWFKNYNQNLWESSIELFGRKMKNVYDYKDFASLYVNEHVETELLYGVGRAYGAELSIKKIKGTLNGSLAYTLSRTERKIAQISDGAWYPSNFDKPHQLAFVFNHQYNQRHSFSMNFVYNTGRPTTAPQGTYRTIQGVAIPIYSTRNWLRIPDYHRLDIAYTFGQGYRKDKKLKTSWTVSIYNLYARKNAFSVFFTQTPFTSGQANKLAILGTIFPSLTFNIETI